MRLRLVLVTSLLVAVIYVLIPASAPSDPWAKKAWVETPNRMGQLAAVANTLVGWPPVLGERWPDIELFAPDGSPFRISSLMGKPVLVELISMTCAGCQAFSGGNIQGGFDGFPAQSGLDTIEKYFSTYSGGEKLISDKMHFVQILVYNTQLDSANAQDARAWRDHFQLTAPNTHVVSATPELANGATFRMIPGFILLDKNQLVRFDSTGHTPRHNLYTELIPGAAKLLR